MIEKGRVSKKATGKIIYQNKYHFTIQYENNQRESFQWVEVKMGKIEIEAVKML